MRALSTTLLIFGMCIGLAPSLRASISFAGSGGQGTDGNSLSFTSGTFTVIASAWSTTGSGGALATAALGQYSPGLGVCNDSERLSGSACTTNPPEHAIGNTGYYDFVLLTFNHPVTSVSLTLSTFGTQQDTDATYFTGTCTTINGCTPLGKTVTGVSPTIGGSTVNGSFSSFYAAPPNNADPMTGTRTFTLDLGTQSSVNWVMIGASTADTTPDDYFKLLSMSYTTGSGVPEPATFGMAGAALAALGLLRRRKRLSANS